MKYVRIGDKNVSVLMLGGNIFGHFCNEQETKDIIDTAYAHGLNCIDTANVYSNGLSEEYIGRALRGRRENFFIATKAGIHSNAVPENRFSKEYILQSAEESLKRLRTTYIDLYQLHAYDTAVPLSETVSALNQLIEKGKVRHIGCSNFTLSQLQEAAEIGANFTTVQLPYNILERKIEKEILPFCNEHNISILPYKALARGILSGKYTTTADLPKNSRAIVSARVREELTQEMLAKVQILKNYSKTSDIALSALSLAWLIAQKGVSLVIVGVRTVEQLIDCIGAAKVTLSCSELEHVDAILLKTQ